MKVFIDTSAFCALSIPKDKHNLKAKLIIQSLLKEKVIFCTSNYILDETYTLLKSRADHQTAVKFLQTIEGSGIEILSVAKAIENKAKKIFIKYPDPKLSYTDCTSFALIDEHQILYVLAFDEHFKYFKYRKHIIYLANGVNFAQ